jgi:hypothetical protein
VSDEVAYEPARGGGRGEEGIGERQPTTREVVRAAFREPPPTERAGSGLEVAVASSGDPRGGDVAVGAGTVYGSPFSTGGAEGGDACRDEAVTAYWELLRGESSAYEIARRRGLRVHASQARVSHTARMAGLRRLLQAAQRGPVRLRCSCADHGGVIRAWLEREDERDRATRRLYIRQPPPVWCPFAPE